MATASQLEQGIKAAQAQSKPELVQQFRTALQQKLSLGWYRAHASQNLDAQDAIASKMHELGMQVLPAQQVQDIDQQQLGDMRQRAIAENTSAPLNFAQGIVHGAASPFIGAGQAVAHALPLSDQTAQAVDQHVAGNKRAFEAGTGSTTSGTVGNLVGEALPYVYGGGVIKAAGVVPKALGALGVTSRAAPYIESALASGIVSGAQPVTNGESRAVNAVTGAALGAAGEAVPRELGVLAKKVEPLVSAGRRAGIRTAEKYGIPLHLSQVTDSKPLQVLSSVTKYMPFAGNTAASRAQQQAFNRALSRQIGEDAPEITDAVLSNARQRLSNGYNELFDRNRVGLNASDVQKLANIANSASKLGGRDVGEIVGNHIDNIIEQVGRDGSMPGHLYQSLRTDTLLPAESHAHPAASYYLKNVRKVLQGAAQRSLGGKDAAELGKLNRQWNTLQILDKAVNKRAAGAGGNISPANLWSLVNSKYGSTPEMRELAQMGQTVLKDPVPDSGTAQRLLYEGGLLGGSAMAPHTVLPGVIAGATVGRAMNSPLAARTLPYAGSRILNLLSGATRPANRLLPLLGAQPDSAFPQHRLHE